MRLKYFEDTDTLYIQMSENEPSATEDLSENVLLDLDEKGNVVGLTIEHLKNLKGSLDLKYKTEVA